MHGGGASSAKNLRDSKPLCYELAAPPTRPRARTVGCNDGPVELARDRSEWWDSGVENIQGDANEEPEGVPRRGPYRTAVSLAPGFSLVRGAGRPRRPGREAGRRLGRARGDRRDRREARVDRAGDADRPDGAQRRRSRGTEYSDP